MKTIPKTKYDKLSESAKLVSVNVTKSKKLANELLEQTKVTKKQKIAWFLIGLSGGIFGLIIALITNLTSKKKKQQHSLKKCK